MAGDAPPPRAQEDTRVLLPVLGVVLRRDVFRRLPPDRALP